MKTFMDTTYPLFRDDRSLATNMAKSELSHKTIHRDLQRGIVSAVAKLIRKFRKRPHCSPAWREALQNLQQQDPKEYRNGLDFIDQLMKEFITALHRASKDPVELGRLFPQVVREGRPFSAVEEDFCRLACCEQEGEGVDPAWDAVYDQILLEPLEPGQPRPITRSFDDLLQVRGLNLRREITAFLQREFPAQFARSSKMIKIGRFGLPIP